MKQPLIMIVDDDPNIRFAFTRTFANKKYRTVAAENGRQALEQIASHPPSVIFMDISMPDMDGLEVLQRIKSQNGNIPVVIITGFGTMQTAMKAIQLGAFEYLTKPLDINKVRLLAERALEMVHLRDALKDMKMRTFQETRKYELIGSSEIMQEVYKKMGAATASPNTTNILIQGESGTGKELVARAIHANGEFAGEPFMAINCTAIQENLFESELFGYEKGAFTGAADRKFGLMEAAAKGTIFLDEIGSLSLHLQQKLLRVLQEREFRRLGGTELLPVEGRFIAATHHNLKDEVAAGRFREDLFYRLNVMLIELPPLRNRREDIPLLAEFFLNRFNRKLKKNIRLIDQEVFALFQEYDFPGNVRELENMMERAMILEKGEVLRLESLQPTSVSSLQSTAELPPLEGLSYQDARAAWLAEFERRYISACLKACNGNATAAAQQAGIKRQSFHRLMKKYHLHSADFRNK